jgi:hypothetical protein
LGDFEAAVIRHTGGCHCGRVRFEVMAPAKLEVSDCNCSICKKSGYLHLTVPKSRFKLLSGSDALTAYQFNTGTARHLFCSACGIKSFYVPRSHPDGKGTRWILFQLWEWRGSIYDLHFYFVADDGQSSCVTRVFRSSCYAISIEPLMRLMVKVGFEQVKRINDVFFRPIIAGHRD